MAAEKIDALQLDVTSSVSTDKVDKLIDSLGRLGTALDKLKSKSVSVNIRQTGEASNKAAGSVDKLSSSFLNQAIRITALIAVYRKLGKVVSDGIANSATYIKSLNMFTVSLGEYADSASKYGETVSQALGIDIAGWQKTQGIFQTLITGFGVTGDKAAYMSQNITQLSYDIASFYGITNEEAANKLKSALSGRLEPIRKLGYDLSQAKLVDIGQNPANYGKQTFTINKETGAIEANTVATDDNTKHKIVNFNQLTQQEKVQLRYIALMQQVTQVQGNYARALNDPANQLNVFKEQLNMTSRSLGNIFIPFLNKALPYLTAFAQLAQQAFQSIANLFGFKLPDMKDRTDISKNVAPYNKVVKATGDAAKNAKKMKDYMLGIDELNVFNPNTGAGGAGGAGGGENSNLKNLKLPGYDFLSKAVENSIKKAKENIQKFFNDLKKNPFLLDDIFKWGASELGANFWEGFLGKSPEQLKKDADAWGMSVGEAFILSFTDKVGKDSADILGVIFGKSPEELGSDAQKYGMTVEEYLLAGMVEKSPVASTESMQSFLDMILGNPDDLARRAQATGRSVGDQFHKEFARATLTLFNSNPISAWLYKITTGRDIEADLSMLESKLSMSGQTMGSTFGNGLAKGMRKTTGEVMTAAGALGKAGVKELKTFNNGKISFSYPGTGEDAGKGYIGGVKKNEGAAKKVGGVIGLASLNQIRKTLGIKSPSREFAKVGKYSVEGYANAIEENTYMATSAVASMSKKALTALGNISSISSGAIMNGTIIDPMSSGTVSMPSNNNAGYAIGAANEGAMASLASNIYQAVVGGMATANLNGERETNIIIDGKEVFKAVETEKRKRGVAISNGAFSR